MIWSNSNYIKYPTTNRVIGISAEGYEIRRNDNGYFGGGYSEWYYIFVDGKPIETDKNGVPKQKQQEIAIEKQTTETKKTNILLFAALGLAAYVLLK